MADLIRKAVASPLTDDPLTYVMSDETVDRMGDVIEASGWRLDNFVKNPIALFGHDHTFIVGHWTNVKVQGGKLIGKLNLLPAGVSERLDEIRAAVEAGVLRAVSVGFTADPEQVERMKTGGLRFRAADLMECSLVSVPANPNALQMAKSLNLSPEAKALIFASDEEAAAKPRTASAISAHAGANKSAITTARADHPGVSGTPVKLSIKEGPKMALAEQIASLEAKRAANAARMEEVATKSINRGETMAADEQEEFDGLEAEVKQIDADLTRLRALERVKLATAKPAAGAKSADTESRNPSTVPAQVRLTEKLDKGIGFARLAKVKALAKLDGESVSTVAKNIYGEDSLVYGVVTKAAVPAGSTLDGNWASPLVGEGSDIFADFVEFLRPRTILGRFGQDGIPSLRRVPFNVPLIGETDGGEGYWVGEGKAKPLTRFGFERNILDIYKVANIAVVTEELLRRSSPAADALLRDRLAAALAARLDIDFVNPAKAAVSGVSPASITNGVTAVASSGGDADAIRADIRALMGTFIAANNAPTTGVWIMGSTTALSLSMMVNPLGQSEFGSINMTGGTFAGLPAIVSDYVPAGTVILANASDIYLADEGGVQVKMSDQAAVEMADNPAHDSTTPTGATSMVSLWQTNSVGFLAERFINWSRRRPSAVAVLTGATWGAPTTP